MAFGNNVVFNISTNNFGTPAPGSDYISGIIFTSTTVPSGFSFSVAKQIFSLKQAEDLGILGDYSDETKATATVTIGASAGATVSIGGMDVTLKVNEPYIYDTTNTTTLGSYKNLTVMSNTQLADKIATAINVQGTGYSAATASNEITLTAKSGLGAIINTISGTVSGTGASDITFGAFSGGVSSTRKLEHYQISEYFRNNINGALWVMYSDTTLDTDLINTMQNQADNEIRLLGIYNNAATDNSTITTDLDAIQAVCATLASNYAPLSVIYSPNLYSYSDLSLLPNLRSRSDWFVSTVIGQDGSATGAYLSKYASKSVPCYGAVLGLTSKVPVSENIGWVGQNSITSGTELSVPAFSNLDKYSTLFSEQNALLTQLDNSGYIFLMTRTGIAGTWVNDSHTDVSKSNDLNYIERVRTIYKVLRESYKALIPLVNSKLILDSTGKLLPTTISVFENAVFPNLSQMVKDGDISDFAVLIDSEQNVQTTSQLEITIRIVGIGIARNIVVNLGYAISI